MSTLASGKKGFTAIPSIGVTIFALLCIAAPASETKNASRKKYEAIEVANGASIRGRVTFVGEVPKPELIINQDRNVCLHEAGRRPSPRLRVDLDGGVADAVVYLKNIASGKPLEELDAALTLDQVGCSYRPFVQVAPFKQTLSIVNSDPVNHNVHAKLDGGDSAFNLAMPNARYPQKQTIRKRLTRPGLLTINCDVHMWMSAYIWVVRHPYYAVTGEDGAFELDRIPPGRYELALWHPNWEAKVRRGADGRTVGYVYAPPIEKSLEVQLEAGEKKSVDFVLNE